ncbi:cation:proton antiporter [Glycomyces buryatensis]|uniref:Cation:proton antiporter n=1 Tax=Glycomyces buryatensis TaxID=2570927 RepID=A0A4S8PUQ6_9ACTN|nr:cation:proton antiporter [Glycomyces buryatensis]THV33462.1 cation:proton antiporter [Glycomyces buryatensis]
MEIIIGQDLAIDLVIVAFAAVLAPLASDRLERWVRLPSVVVEILIGIAIGPYMLGLVEPGIVLASISDLGMALLFFLAGYEIDFRAIRGKPIALAVAGWIVSFAAAFLLVRTVDAPMAALIIAIGISSTALGTILPIARDAGLLSDKVGPSLMATGAVGEFAPIMLLALLFSEGSHDGKTTLVIGLAGLAVAAAFWGSMRHSERVSRMLSATLGTSVQFAIRLCVLVLLAAVLLAVELGVDIALGAFAAGVCMHVLLSALDEREAEQVQSKLDGIGFGWLVPVFFIYTGIGFELGELLSSPAALALIPVFLGLFALVRGVVTWAVFARLLNRAQRATLAPLAATQLPIVVIAAGVAADRGLIDESVEAAMVGAAMLSVLLFPLIALRAARRSAPEKASEVAAA